MKWSTDKPVEPGWYWTRIGDFPAEDDDLVYVSYNRRMNRWEAIEVNDNEPCKLDYFGDYCKWYGPIQPPE